MSSSRTETFQGLLARFKAFAGLNSEDLAWLAARAQPFHCSIGQEVLVPDRVPEYCYCLLEGRGRVLHQDPGLQRPVTLAYAQPGDLVGWAGLVRRDPCEWITAVTPLKLIGFRQEEFFELERRSQAFADWLDANNSPAELMTVLAPALRRRPQANPPERDVLRALLPALQLVPARASRDLPIEDGAVWLWNAQPADAPVCLLPNTENRTLNH
jgi:ATP-binding cassette subfamily B protein